MFYLVVSPVWGTWHVGMAGTGVSGMFYLV